ncbi:MAG TPA: S8 family serine peptidase [Dokdonella sp.]
MRKPITTAILTALVSTLAASAPQTPAWAAAKTPAAASVKVLAPKGSFGAGARGVEALEDYGRFVLYRVDAPALARAQQTSASLSIDSDADRLQFSAHPFDTQRETPSAPAPFSLQTPGGAALQIVQFVGPVKQAWLDALAARGIRPVHYVPSNGYLVWADEAAQARLANLRSTAGWLQYAAPFHGFLKVDPELGGRLAANPAADDEVDVTVQIYVHDGADATRQFVQSKGILSGAQRAPLGAGTPNYTWSPILQFQNLDLRVRLSDIAPIAERADVTFVGAKHQRTLMDEKQALILAGDFAPGLASPSYLQFLLDHGFSQDPAAYPLIDLTDSTIDEGGTGATVLDTADEMLHRNGDLAQPARIAYFKNCSDWPDDQVGAADGHGSLNAGIIGDYDQRSGYPFQDEQGQHLGLGINPFARIGSTVIFVSAPPQSNDFGCGGNDQGVVDANALNGAKISSNSWGYSASLTYSSPDQTYDAAVRDVDVASAGNQPMIYVFAASNDGPGAGTVGAPGSAKNTITVGASENLRPFTGANDICPSDDASAADDPQSVAGFSSRGPASGQRVKPEVIAPGTHIQAGASVYSGFQGGGVCIQYYPQSPAQTEFAVSSGTSHATPAMSGLASLAYWWIEQGGAGAAVGTIDEIGGARAPSPALMKAWLMAHPSYLTGTYANDDLPSNNQGYGMPNMSDMFSATPKVLLDQSEVFDNTGETRSYTFGVADPTQPLRIAMAYTDAPGELGASPQVNDLDLAVSVGGQTYLGNHFDHQWSVPGGSADNANNYEAVFLPAGTEGDITISVTAANIAGDGVPASGDATDQDFALVCSNCSQAPSFTLSAEAALQVCAGSETQAAIRLVPTVGFADPVTLAASGNPAGTRAAFAPNPATPPNAATLTLAADAAATPGTYAMTISGASGSLVRTQALDLGVFNTLPEAALDASPTDGSIDVSTTPTFSWNAAEHAYGYLVQIATDPAFAGIVRSHETTDTAWTVGSGEALDSSARYWWRVIARNPCGDSAPAGGADTVFIDGFESAAPAPVQEFTTQPLPGDCPVDVPAVVVFSDDMENGGAGWTHAAASGSSDSWSLGAAANSGSHAWQANAPAAGAANDQWLVSPGIDVPANLSSLSLKFWNRQDLKAGDPGTCGDGALVEVSTNGGSLWNALGNVLVTPYDGTVGGGFGNPLAGKAAWCGDPRSYSNTIIDAQNVIGHSVKFRFRLGHDRFVHRADPAWAIDDVKLTGCAQ